MKRVAILGSTGSIGKQTLDIIRQHPDRLQVGGLAAAKNGWELIQQGLAFGVDRLVLYDQASAEQFNLAGGMDALVDLATDPDIDLVVVSVAGVIGLLPTIAAIESGKQIALASKEVLVAAGEVVMPLVEKHGVLMTPIDSEHSALFQCLQGYAPSQIKELILTASGGPFRGRSRSELETVTVDEALNHPTWRMGGKITIDSATLMNKGLETIEAKWLFGVTMGQVDVVVHPQSIVHSFVKFQDGSVLGQCGWPDMRLPIQYALLYPERKPNDLPDWSPLDSPALTFEKVDHDAFPCIGIARRSAEVGGTMPCVMNAANEEAANAFLRGDLPFGKIPGLIEECMSRHDVQPAGLESLLDADRWARETSQALMELL